MKEKSVFDHIFDAVLLNSFSDLTGASHNYNDDTKEHTIVVQAPGYKKEDIDVEVDSEGISIKGAISDEKFKSRLRRNSFNYGMDLYGIDSETVDASLEHGILTVKFKTEKGKTSKKVTIK